MGRGSYLGGSTIINTISRRRSKAFRKRKAKASLTSTKAAVQVGRVPKCLSIEETALNLVAAVIHAEVRELPLPRVSQSYPSELVKEISTRGDILAWARCHPEYERLMDKKLRRMPRPSVGLSEMLERRELGIGSSGIWLFQSTFSKALEKTVAELGVDLELIAHKWNATGFLTARGGQWNSSLIDAGRRALDLRERPSRSSEGRRPCLPFKTGRILT